VNPKRDEPTSRRIEILREDVSRKIAAGEVIDRPFSVVRELLDNSIDAGAGSLDVYIEGGGISRIRVVDDGEGMSRDDLSLCAERHATSKVREESDLYRVRTLGFRGEALASVSVCSRLEIVSKIRRPADSEQQPAHRLRVAGAKILGLEECQGNPGTVVDVSELFYNLPARRKFLKSTAAETAMCRQAFLEKAVAHPGLCFRFFVNGKLKVFLPPHDPASRCAEAFALPLQHFSVLQGERSGLGTQPDAGITIVAARPELSRRDKRLIQIYVNRRRIQEYSLVHAVTYPYSAYLPGGRFPAAFVFLELNPETVDFNIHPAKREARFRNLPLLHQVIAGRLKKYLQSFDLRIDAGEGASPASTAEEAGRAFPGWGSEIGLRAGEEAGGGGREFLSSRDLLSLGRGSVEGGGPGKGGEPAEGEGGAGKQPAAEREAKPAQAVEPIYRGQLFKLFLLVEYGSSLFILDQHAAHERLLFERFSSGKPASQELLMPIRLDIGPQAPELIAARRELFERLGIRVEVAEDGVYEISSLPEELLCIEEEELVEAVLWEKGSVEELVNRVYSLASCRLAIKEGQELDRETATELVRRVFRLTNARCPHGRPIWYELKEEQLLKAVERL